MYLSLCIGRYVHVHGVIELEVGVVDSERICSDSVLVQPIYPRLTTPSARDPLIPAVDP